LLENGSPRPATVGLLAAHPLEVLLVVDTSGSMRGAPLDAAKVAAAGFLTALPPTTRTAVMGFGAAPGPAGGFSEDPADAAADLGRLQAAGETSLYDAVVAALDALDAAGPGRPFIVLLSDGGDTASRLSLADAVARLQGSEVRFYAVELQTEESDPASLQALAEVGAGRVVAAEDPAALAAMYELIASELVNQLVVSYTSAAGGPTDLAITITHGITAAAAAARVTLPGSAPAPTTTLPATPTTAGTGPGTTGAPATTAAPSPPTSAVASGPGLLGAPWALPAGLGAMFVAALTVILLALFPADRAGSRRARAARAERAGQAEHERFSPAGGLLTHVADRARGAAEAALNRGGRQSRLSRALDSAGLRLAAGEFVILTISAAIVGAVVGGLLFRLPGAVALGALSLVVPRLLVNRSRRKRRDAFAVQLDGTLQLLSGSMRAGYGLLQSVNNICAEAASPTAEEFGRIMVETRLGRDLVESLTALADRMDSDDFRWVAQAIDIQRSVGGDLSQILDTVSQTIRERNQIRRQIKALSAEGRISSYILIAIPFFLAAFILLMAPEFIAPLWTTTSGKVAVAVGVALMLAGIAWIRRLVRLKF
ncbi:MAG: putative type secretion system integral rane subunit, partial [Acidobacteria bacterium]|nr:putative type secretion system integral rane subunit [Acidobacteriota bacterium]